MPPLAIPSTGSTAIPTRAFTAGVQHALDKMTATIDRLLMDPHTSEYLIGTAANILANVHEGTM
jgi:hypothetical protein